jgi:ATP-dependent DNA helicase RecG
MLEITSPGPLPDNLPPDALGTGRSEIRNRILAPIFKELKLIEAWGTGIRKMKSETEKFPDIELILQEIGHAFQVQFLKKKAKMLHNEIQVTGQVTKEIELLLGVLKGEMTRAAIQEALGLTGRNNFENRYLKPALVDALIELTLPDKPKSSKQKYRLTKKGQTILRNN